MGIVAFSRNSNASAPDMMNAKRIIWNDLNPCKIINMNLYERRALEFERTHRLTWKFHLSARASHFHSHSFLIQKNSWTEQALYCACYPSSHNEFLKQQFSLFHFIFTLLAETHKNTDSALTFHALFKNIITHHLSQFKQIRNFSLLLVQIISIVVFCFSLDLLAVGNEENSDANLSIEQWW